MSRRKGSFRSVACTIAADIGAAAGIFSISVFLKREDQAHEAYNVSAFPVDGFTDHK